MMLMFRVRVRRARISVTDVVMVNIGLALQLGVDLVFGLDMGFGLGCWLGFGLQRLVDVIDLRQ